MVKYFIDPSRDDRLYPIRPMLATAEDNLISIVESITQAKEQMELLWFYLHPEYLNGGHKAMETAAASIDVKRIADLAEATMANAKEMGSYVESQTINAKDKLNSLLTEDTLELRDIAEISIIEAKKDREFRKENMAKIAAMALESESSDDSTYYSDIEKATPIKRSSPEDLKTKKSKKSKDLSNDSDDESDSEKVAKKSEKKLRKTLNEELKKESNKASKNDTKKKTKKEIENFVDEVETNIIKKSKKAKYIESDTSDDSDIEDENTKESKSSHISNSHTENSKKKKSSDQKKSKNEKKNIINIIDSKDVFESGEKNDKALMVNIMDTVDSDDDISSSDLIEMLSGKKEIKLEVPTSSKALKSKKEISSNENKPLEEKTDKNKKSCIHDKRTEQNSGDEEELCKSSSTPESISNTEEDQPDYSINEFSRIRYNKEIKVRNTFNESHDQYATRAYNDLSKVKGKDFKKEMMKKKKSNWTGQGTITTECRSIIYSDSD